MRMPRETLQDKACALMHWSFHCMTAAGVDFDGVTDRSTEANRNMNELTNAPWCTDCFSYWITTSSAYFEGWTIQILKLTETETNNKTNAHLCTEHFPPWVTATTHIQIMSQPTPEQTMRLSMPSVRAGPFFFCVQ